MGWSGPLYKIYERRLAQSLPPGRLPAHIGVILDGHRRFARAEGHVDYSSSYRSGMAKLEEFLGWCAHLDLPAVTAWVLSVDNLRRPAEELDPYFRVLIDLLDRLPELADRLGFSLQVIGSLDLLPANLAEAVKQAEQRCPTGRWHVNLALGYGGREEIVDACRSLVADLVADGIAPDDLPEHIDTAGLSDHLYTGGLPDPDLVIRTSGEVRLSGFLLWQSAYAECVFVDPYWPAFRRVDFLRALRDYAQRDRRFGR
ncbi:MAG: isoprenyl transferase [Acidimicrobiaceae bacterium]|jgi:short-chain Z-isoprenyl diphosphate synthase|nr:isoprenyl transferase [Acidimicrobiaceae bacterium]